MLKVRSPEKKEAKIIESDYAKGRSNSNMDKSDNDQIKKEGQEFETLYVERRYCTVCGLDQPLRAKHCKDCNRCVAQYDHHCPWIGTFDTFISSLHFLGTCIGEKNHLLFYFFLIFQLIELICGEKIVIFLTNTCLIITVN